MTIDLAENQVGAEGAEYLAEALHVNQVRSCMHWSKCITMAVSFSDTDYIDPSM